MIVIVTVRLDSQSPADTMESIKDLEGCIHQHFTKGNYPNTQLVSVKVDTNGT